MCDYSLTDNPADSDMHTEQEDWKPVAVSEVEEKMQNLSTKPVEPKVEASPSSSPGPQTEIEADYSEPEEVSLKGPLVKEAASLPESSHTLPESSTPESKGQPEVKTPAAPKAPPAGADAEMKEIMKLRPFLRFGTDIDSYVAKTNFTPPDRVALPKSSLKPRSKSRPSSRAPSRAPSRGPSRPQTPKRSAKSPERQEVL